MSQTVCQRHARKLAVLCKKTGLYATRNTRTHSRHRPKAPHTKVKATGAKTETKSKNTDFSLKDLGVLRTKAKDYHHWKACQLSDASSQSNRHLISK